MENLSITSAEKESVLKMFNLDITIKRTSISTSDELASLPTLYKDLQISQERADILYKIVHEKGLWPFFYDEKELDFHPKGNIIKVFYETLCEWFSPSDSDCTYAANFGESVLADLRSNYNIGLDETILFDRDTSFWSNDNQGLVITDEGFYCIPDNDDLSSKFKFSWKDFDRVRYKELNFYFYNGEQVIATLSKNFL